MKTMNTFYIVGTVFFTAILAVVATLAYLDDKPRIKATGEYSSWNSPPTVSLGGMSSYIRLDIRNVGNAEAKEIKLSTPFQGEYVINDKGDSLPLQFENDIQLDDLNPSEGHIVEIWSQSSRVWIGPGDVYISHTRGKSDADFGYHFYGAKGKIFDILSIYWMFPVILLVTTLLIWVVARFGQETQESQL